VQPMPLMIWAAIFIEARAREREGGAARRGRQGGPGTHRRTLRLPTSGGVFPARSAARSASALPAEVQTRRVLARQLRRASLALARCEPLEESWPSDPSVFTFMSPGAGGWRAAPVRRLD
jgi:hypothetical protein